MAANGVTSFIITMGERERPTHGEIRGLWDVPNFANWLTGGVLNQVNHLSGEMARNPNLYNVSNALTWASSAT